MFSKGNHKLPKDIAIFNLPHMITCPGATAECKQYCYAVKAERQYRAVIPYRFRNWELSKSKEFVNQAIGELSRMRILRAVRIHESGDFYNQSYLNKWVRIIKAFPHITFTAYTKSLHLDFTEAKKCKNLVLFASVDPTTPAFMREKNTIRRKAVVLTRKGKAPKGYFLCPGSCKKCDHCYVKPTSSVAFKKH